MGEVHTEFLEQYNINGIFHGNNSHIISNLVYPISTYIKLHAI